ncbi:MAG: transcription elongation factor GreA [Clostridia bacterium]|nr:transcription elongation factor GreA [Clostridia bacterium]
MQKEILLTAQGLKALEDELDYLKTTKRKEMAEKIALARSYGDLSENSEYDDAKNEQAQMEARIADIEVTLKHARILDESEISNEHVHIGSKVKVFNTLFEEEVVYNIVSASEAEPENNKISDESPVGHALLDKKVGEKVTVDLPNGTQLELDVLEITR